MNDQVADRTSASTSGACSSSAASTTTARRWARTPAAWSPRGRAPPTPLRREGRRVPRHEPRRHLRRRRQPGQHEQRPVRPVTSSRTAPRFYRSQLTEEETAAGDHRDHRRRPAGSSNYEAIYPDVDPSGAPGVARGQGRPADPEHDAGDATLVALRDERGDRRPAWPTGLFPPSTYPLESVGKRNPTLPNRLEPFRDFSVGVPRRDVGREAFPGFYLAPGLQVRPGRASRTAS